MKMNQSLTMQYEIKNIDRKWYQVWKPRYVPKEVTIHDADITIGNEEIDENGNVSYTVKASPKDIVVKFEQAVKAEELNKLPTK